MELNDLKQNWQNAGGINKSETELLNMTRISQNPSLKKIRRKLIVETVFLLFFLFIYYDWFDGGTKPLYANITLLSGLLLYIANDVIGYAAIANPVSGLNLKISVINYFYRIKRLAVFSVVVSFLYSASLLVFFTSVIEFNRGKRFLLIGLIIILFQLVFWSSRVWIKWIKNLKKQVEEFDGNVS